MRRTFPMLSAVLAGLGLSVAPAFAAYSTPFANWNFCTANSFSVCMDFTLMQDDADAGKYLLTVTYVSTLAPTGQEGVMTAVGLLRDASAPSLTATNVQIVSTSPTVSWSLGGGQLSGGGPIVIVVAGNSNSGTVNGLPVTGSVSISFESVDLASYDVSNLYARAHIQSFGSGNCSIKPDSRAADHLVDGAADADANCGTLPPNTTVPEPITMVLVGSGLLGVGAAHRRRRRLEASRMD